MDQRRRTFLGAVASGLGGTWWLSQATHASEAPATPDALESQDLGDLVAQSFHKKGRS